MNRQIQGVEARRQDAESLHLDQLVEFAGRAWRRQLGPEEQSGIQAFYERLRDSDGLTHEQAIRDGVVSILMSPRIK